MIQKVGDEIAREKVSQQFRDAIALLDPSKYQRKKRKSMKGKMAKTDSKKGCKTSKPTKDPQRKIVPPSTPSAPQITGNYTGYQLTIGV